MTKTGNISLIFGGTRSGKSQYAEDLVEKSGLDKVYLATGQAGDEEMRARIFEHQSRRRANWVTVETKVLLADALGSEARDGRIVLVDCLTFWLSSLMFEGLDIAVETEKLVSSIKALSTPVVFVSNEVGFGIVPDNEMARAFRDHQGRLNQKIAEVADYVVFVAAGLPLVLKPQN